MRPLSVYLPATRVLSKLLWLFVFLIFTFSASAQNRTELEKQRKQKEREIQLTKKMLAETAEKHKQTLQYLRVLNKQIKSRQELIGTLQNEVHLLNLNIERGNDIVTALQADLKALKEEYAQLVYFMYKNRSAYNMLNFVFAAESFNEAFKRWKFIQFYSEYRKKEMDLIVKTEKALNEKVADLRSKQEEKQALLAGLNNQKKELEQDKSSQSRLAQRLQGDEKKLKKELREQQRIAAKLDKAIEDIIAREMAAANKKTTDPSGRTTYGMTPEAAKLAAEFAGNRAKLPWPVERGVISERYGKHAHPTLAGIYVNNNGIKIRAPKGEKARAVFDGEVSSVVEINGANQSIIVKHGNYFTVYSNLHNVTLKTGDKVTIKQELGTVAENSSNGETELGIQIWQHNGQSMQKLDPELWLYRK